MKRLQRKIFATHDYGGRDEAVSYINGQIYTASTHARCINQYLTENGKQQKLDSNVKRPKEDIDGVDKMAFGHLLNYEKELYVEENSLQNMTIDEAASIFKSFFPDYKIYNDDTETEDYWDENGDLKDNQYTLLVASKLRKIKEI